MSFIISSVLFVLLAAHSTGALDNGLARTPPMGWMSWERFTCNLDCNQYPDDCISSKLYRDMANRLVFDGYAELGYEYVNIDDCWSEMERDPDSGNLRADASRFPGGIGELAGYMHSRNLKMGIYGDCGTKTCAGYPAQLKTEENLEDNYFDLDAKRLADWQIDAFKFDGCYLDPARAESICPKMSKAIQATKRPVMIVCEWPFYMLRERYSLRNNLAPNFTLAQEACNTWRYYEDVEDSWLSILNIIDFTIRIQKAIARYHGPGHWFDPDQLVIGNYALSLDQARAQMAIWCLWSAPLYMSNDLRDIQPEMAAVLKNKRLIQVNQDRLGVFGMMVASQENGRYQAFVKPVEPMSGACPSYMIVFLNRQTLGDKRYLSFNVRELLLGVDYELVASRLQSLNNTSVQDYSAPYNCKKFIQLAMTKDPKSAELLNRPPSITDLGIEYKQVLYRVYDLFEDESDMPQVSLDGELKLKVNPSGVRAVILV